MRETTLMDSTSLKKRSDLHLARKIWHFLGVLTMIVIFHNVSRPVALQLITIFSFVFILFDILRQQSSPINNFVINLMHPFMRESERNSMAGTSYLFVGVFLIILLFPKNIVILALMFLGVADPLASFVGIKYGSDKILGSKSLQGSIAAFVCCTLISGIYYFAHNLMTERLFMVSILSGLIGALAELLPVGRLDDNFTIPVVSSCLLWLLFHLFGGF